MRTTITAMPSRAATISRQPEATGWARIGRRHRQDDGKGGHHFSLLRGVPVGAGVVSVDVLLDDRVDALVDVDHLAALVGLKGLEGRELRLEQRGRHEVAGAAGLPSGDDLGAALEVEELRVGAWRRSWSRYFRLSAEQLITPPAGWPASHSPIASSHGPAVVVVKRLAGGHLRDVGRGGSRRRPRTAPAGAGRWPRRRWTCRIRTPPSRRGPVPGRRRLRRGLVGGLGCGLERLV